jgi:four helix bundle protein
MQAPKTKSHKDLDVWKLSIELAIELYRFANTLPIEEKFGMNSQIKRAATSVPMNIAEGAGRRTPGAFIQFLNYSMGSLSEIDTQMEICLRLGYIDDIKPIGGQIILIRRMITNLIRALELKKGSNTEDNN